MQTFVILHNLRSTHNVGSIFRTADGAGVTKIFLTGYTPAPKDRFGRMDSSIQKTALGATESVSWEVRESIHELLDELRKKGTAVVAVEQTKEAIEYTSWRPTKDVAYIFGNEIEGVPGEVCERADAVIQIPMHGMKESLNVSVSAGIVLFDRLT